AELDNLSLLAISCDVKPNKPSMVWRPLLPNLQCIQVPLTKVPSVLDLYTFDTISSGGSRLGEELMNNSKTLSKTLDTPANQVQPTSIQFAPNLEPIQNAL
ncbi:20327_t:CDS:2, partial [Gigaspora rosea]